MMGPGRGSPHLPGGQGAQAGLGPSARGQSSWPAPGNAAEGAEGGLGVGRRPLAGPAAERSDDWLTSCPKAPTQLALHSCRGPSLIPHACHPNRDSSLGTK